MSNSKFAFTNLILIIALIIVLSGYISYFADNVAHFTNYFFAVICVPVIATVTLSSLSFVALKHNLSTRKRYLIFVLPAFTIISFQIFAYWFLQNGQY